MYAVKKRVYLMIVFHTNIRCFSLATGYHEGFPPFAAEQQRCIAVVDKASCVLQHNQEIHLQTTTILLPRMNKTATCYSAYRYCCLLFGTRLPRIKDVQQLPRSTVHCTYIHTYIHTYVRTYTHTHTHAHTHTYSPENLPFF